MGEFTFPLKLNSATQLGVPDMDQWEKGAAAATTYEETEASIESQRKLYKWLRIGSIVLIVIGIMDLWGLMFVIPLLILNWLLKGLDPKLQAAQRRFLDVAYEHADMVAYEVGQKLMSGTWTRYRNGLEVILYNNDRFVYLNTSQSLVVGYNKADIKEVTRERLHTGAQTSGTSNTYGGGTAIGNTGIVVGGAQTQTSSSTTDYYEWHFDVLTSFFEYPKVSLILPDSPSVEDAIGEAYAILKP
ncbi:hypothetical protein [Lacticaseibacillus absianus]|uniref:hypothetical protein n=1 Tax=Lacticaseibacillus absianus TaxID=2729623 RepID=UPI0015C99617|nr:hypothetical protein [Lacticaseibacillus absianus]